MTKTNDFPGAITKMKELAPIVNEYDFEDVSKAIYCISVCVNNRSVLESALSLNWALAEHNHKGKKKIDNYVDFKEFFFPIKDIIKPSAVDDAVVEDYGDVSIDVFGKKYSVIVGTGHNMVFACLQFLPQLAIIFFLYHSNGSSGMPTPSSFSLLSSIPASLYRSAAFFSRIASPSSL